MFTFLPSSDDDFTIVHLPCTLDKTVFGSCTTGLGTLEREVVRKVKSGSFVVFIKERMIKLSRINK